MVRRSVKMWRSSSTAVVHRKINDEPDVSVRLASVNHTQNSSKTQSQSKWLGDFGVSLSPQCWCTRFGDRIAINNFERDE